MLCKNCNAETLGEYCHVCGQSSRTGRLDVQSAIKDFVKSLIHIERGGFYTISQLMTKPGKTVINYINGKRVRHFRPISLLIWISAINLIVQNYLGQFATTKNTHIIFEADGMIKSIAESPALLFMITLPFIAFGFWLWIKSDKINYSEHIYIQLFAAIWSGCIQLIVCPVLILLGLEIGYVTLSSLLIGFVATLFIYKQVYTQFMKTSRATFIILLSYASALVILIGIATVISLIALNLTYSSN